MKKIITMAIAAMFSAVTFAQEVSENVMRIKTMDGTTTPLLLNNVKNVAFEEITPLTMNIEVTNITTTSMDIEFDMPDACKYYLMCIQKEEITGTDLEVRKAIREKYNDQFYESKFLRIPNFEPGTTYYIYTLLFDKDGVPAGIAKTSATTLAPVSDEFKIEVSNVMKNSAMITFTPKDPNMTYYPFLVSEETRQLMIEKYGEVRKADLEYNRYLAEQGGYDLDFWLGFKLVKGTKVLSSFDILNVDLEAGTKYYAYCFGMNADGTFTTEVYEQTFTTETIKPSENQITCEVLQEYSDGCDVKITTTNNDPYMVCSQPKAVWEQKLAEFNNDKAAAVADIFRISYGGQANDYTMQGSQESTKINCGYTGTDYVLLVCGYDGGITTDVQVVPFKTLP